MSSWELRLRNVLLVACRLGMQAAVHAVSDSDEAMAALGCIEGNAAVCGLSQCCKKLENTFVPRS